MKKRGLLLLLVFLFVSCGDKRPDNTENFTISLNILSPLEGGVVTVFDGEKEIAQGTISEGFVELLDISTANVVRVTVCKGVVNLVSREEGVEFGGCLVSLLMVSEKEQQYEVVVDFLSTLVASYLSQTAEREWLDYLGMESAVSLSDDLSLTDAAKSYLWQQSLALVAKKISDAKGITPETSLSTEKLLTFIVDDLEDNNVIDGSTKALFGDYSVNESLFRTDIPSVISAVSDNFTETDLKAWKESLATAKCSFLKSETADSGEGPNIVISSPHSSVLSGKVLVAVSAEDDDGVEYLRCSSDRGEIIDEDGKEAVFTGFIDTEVWDDGLLRLTCTASDGVYQTEKSMEFQVSNKNSVIISITVHEAVENISSILAYDLDGVFIKSIQKNEEGVFSGLMPAGVYLFTIDGGEYLSNIIVAPSDKTVDPPQTRFSLDSELSSRLEIKPEVENRVIINPITTIREIVYRALKSGGESSEIASVHSISYLQMHYGKDFDPYVVPRFVTPGSNDTTTFLAIAALEYQANAVAIAMSVDEGTVSLSMIMHALEEDLMTDRLFNGKNSGGFPLYINVTKEFDSYFFRQYNALALKNFIENESESDVDSFLYLINAISMDSSPLFPTDKAPKSVTETGAIISDKQFKRGVDEEWKEYSIDNKIYSTDQIFKLRFKVVAPEELAVAAVEINSDEIETVGLIEKSGDIYTVFLKYREVDSDGESQKDGMKSLVIRSVDSGGTVMLSPVDTIRDTINPSLEITEIPEGDYVSLPFSVAYAAQDENMLVVESAVQKVGSSAVFKELILFEGNKQFSESETDGDGAYTFLIRATDKAGNSTVNSFDISIDATPPVIENMVLNPEVYRGFLWEDELVVAITAIDNITTSANLQYSYTLDGGDVVVSDSRTITISSLPNGEHTLVFSVMDEAGNNSINEIIVEVDLNSPTVEITNKDLLTARSFRSDDLNLQLEYNLNDVGSGLDICTITVNDLFPEKIVGESKSLAYNAAFIEGNNTIYLECYDKSGQKSSDDVVVVIDTHSPSFTVDVKNYSWSGGELDSFNRHVSSRAVKATVDTDEIGFIVNWRLECPSRGFKFESTLEVFETDGLPEDTVLLNGYECVLHTEVVDSAGNVGYAPVVRWTVDRTPPKINWTLQNIYTENNISFDLTFDEESYVEKLFIDGVEKPVAMWSEWCDTYSSHSYANGCQISGLTEGSHTIKLLLRDVSRKVNNVGSESDCKENNYSCLEKTVEIDAEAPNLNVVIDSTTNSSVTFTASSTDVDPIPTVTGCDIVQTKEFPQIGFIHLKECPLSFGSHTVSVSGVGDSTKPYLVRFGIERNAQTANAFSSFTLDTAMPDIRNIEILNPQYFYYDAEFMKVKVYLGARERRITGSAELSNRRILQSFTQDVDDNIPISRYSFVNTDVIDATYSIDEDNTSSFIVDLRLNMGNHTVQNLKISITDGAGNYAERSFPIVYNKTRYPIQGKVLPYLDETGYMPKRLALMMEMSIMYDFSDGEPFFPSGGSVEDGTVKFYKDGMEIPFDKFNLNHVCQTRLDQTILNRKPLCFANNHSEDGYFKIYCIPASVKCWFVETNIGDDDYYQLDRFAWPEGVDPNDISVTYKVREEYGDYSAVFKSFNE